MTLEKEQELFAAGYQLIAGMDEAGRGPLAGPVVAACVVLRSDFQIDSPELELVKDSKKLSAKQREKIFPLIKQKAIAVGIGVCDHKTIDKINILAASLLAMKKSLTNLCIQPEYILVDGRFVIPDINTPQAAIIDGDAKIFAIAAASIIAKVSRDWLMSELDKKYPGYDFAKHKGYGTKAHLEAILKLGPSPIHRLSFEPLKTWVKKKKPRR